MATLEPAQVSQSPKLRAATAPSPKIKPKPLRVSKRIIICCDGTWQDGIVQKKRWQYSNILRLSRTFHHEDVRHDPPIPQIVFYQAGIGSEHNFYSEFIEGATGSSLAEKVQEAYAFISQNFHTGDEIFIFGFSRGAYTARMCAAFIGEIGVLDKKDMDHFADIFIAYQKRGKSQDAAEIAECNKILEPFTNPNANGRLRADADLDQFTIKCVGVFDTVGSVGLPEELTFSKRLKQLFGFPDKLLGTHIQHAFHAMAMNETRKDFDVAKFEQTPEGKAKGQVLKQVWFAGSHSDVGGGWAFHDLSDITLAWMASNIEGMLALDIDYLCKIPRPVASWGNQLPHNPQTGIFTISESMARALPTKTDDVTCETVHPSVMNQTVKLPDLESKLKVNPGLLGSLAPLEDQIKVDWPYTPGQHMLHGKVVKEELENQASEMETLLEMAKNAAERTEIMTDEGGRPRYETSWLGRILHEIGL